jgi:hypothetical protein
MTIASGSFADKAFYRLLVTTKSASCSSSSTETNSAVKKTVLGLVYTKNECVICPKTFGMRSVTVRVKLNVIKISWRHSWRNFPYPFIKLNGPLITGLLICTKRYCPSQCSIVVIEISQVFDKSTWKLSIVAIIILTAKGTKIKLSPQSFVEYLCFPCVLSGYIISNFTQKKDQMLSHLSKNFPFFVGFKMSFSIKKYSSSKNFGLVCSDNPSRTVQIQFSPFPENTPNKCNPVRIYSL